MTIKFYSDKILLLEHKKGEDMGPACPISFRQIDATIVRINSFSISLMLLAYLFSSEILFIYILGIDLIIRLFIKKSLSPINQLSRLIKTLICAETTQTDAAAKRLAAYFALGFSWTVVLLHSFGFLDIAAIVAVIFVACSLMELFLNFCVGCKVYFIFKKLTV